MHSHPNIGRGLTPLKEAVRIAGEIEQSTGEPCPLTIHYGDPEEGVEMRDILDLLRPGDVVAHYLVAIRMAQKWGHGAGREEMSPAAVTAFDSEGKLKECVWKARERGILFDPAFAPLWYSVKNIRQSFAEGFYPDILGTDLIRASIYCLPLINLPHMMSLLLCAGMPLEQLISAATCNTARAYNFLEDAGTLEAGRPADVTIFSIENMTRTSTDLLGDSIQIDRFIMPQVTIKQGRTDFMLPIFGAKKG